MKRQLLALITLAATIFQIAFGTTKAQTPPQSIAFVNVNVVPFDLLLLDANPLESVANLSKRAGVMVRGRWLPESELRKTLENIAALNRE